MPKIVRTEEDWQRLVDEQGKACRKLNERIKEQNNIIEDMNQEIISLKHKIKTLTLHIEKLEDEQIPLF